MDGKNNEDFDDSLRGVDGFQLLEPLNDLDPPIQPLIVVMK